MDVIFNQILEVATPREIRSPYSSEVVLDWENPTWEVVPFPVSVQPNGTSEGEIESPQTRAGFVIITPPETDIPALGAGSRVKVGEVMVLSIDGPPERWPDPFNPGRVHHLEATAVVFDG